MQARTLSEGEKRDVAAAALAVFRPLHPDCAIKIVVEDETDDRGVPRYSVQVNPRPETTRSGFKRSER